MWEEAVPLRGESSLVYGCVAGWLKSAGQKSDTKTVLKRKNEGKEPPEVQEKVRTKRSAGVAPERDQRGTELAKGEEGSGNGDERRANEH